MKKHSYLTNGKTVSTADQLIKMIELNGGVLSNAGSTPDYVKDNARRERHCKYLMFFARQFQIPNWWTVTTDNLNQWVEKFSKIKISDPEQFTPITWEKFENELKTLQAREKKGFKVKTKIEIMKERNMG